MKQNNGNNRIVRYFNTLPDVSRTSEVHAQFLKLGKDHELNIHWEVVTVGFLSLLELNCMNSHIAGIFGFHDLLFCMNFLYATNFKLN